MVEFRAAWNPVSLRAFMTGHSSASFALRAKAPLRGTCLNRKYLDLRWWWSVLDGTARIFQARIGFRPEVIDKRIEDVSCKFFISNPTARVWYGDPRNDSSVELRFVRDHILKPGSRVIECGVHHGLETIVLSRWVGGDGVVYACEAMPENVSVI